MSKSASHVGRGIGPCRETPAGVWYGPVRPPELDGADAPAEAAPAEAVREAIGDEGRESPEMDHSRVERVREPLNTARGGPGAQYTKVPLCTRKALSGPELTHPVLYLLRTKILGGSSPKAARAARSSAIKHNEFAILLNPLSDCSSRDLSVDAPAGLRLRERPRRPQQLDTESERVCGISPERGLAHSVESLTPRTSTYSTRYSWKFKLEEAWPSRSQRKAKRDSLVAVSGRPTGVWFSMFSMF